MVTFVTEHEGLLAAARRAGHSATRVTESHYAKVLDPQARRAADAWAKALGG